MKPSTRYLRDARAIASAWGVNVYAGKRGMREKQLQPVRAALLLPDFPKKAKSGWPKDEVLAWGLSHMELSKDRRAITLVKGQGSRAESMAGKETSGAEPRQREFGFEEKLTRFSPDYQKRLIGLYDKWLNPNSVMDKSLTRAEHVELERAGLIETVETETEGDDITGGVRGVANHIRNNFPGIVCNHMDISRWMRGDYLPPGCTENFPGPNERGAYPKLLVHSWVERYLKKTAAGQSLPFTEDPRQALELLELETKREEFRVWKQEHSDKYLLTETANRTGSAIGSVARNSTREAIEKQAPKRFLAGLAEIIPDEKIRLRLGEKLRADCATAFNEWQSQFTGRLAELMQRAAQAEK